MSTTTTLVHILLMFSFLSLSFHVCNARFLIGENSGRALHDFRKVGEVSVDESVIPENTTGTLPEKELQQGSEDGGGLFNGSSAGASSEKPKEGIEHVPRGMEKKKGRLTGNELLMSSSHVGVHQATKLEEPRKQGRPVLGSEYDVSHVATSDESIGSKETDIDDIVAMDYAQPHRKPPINNK